MKTYSILIFLIFLLSQTSAIYDYGFAILHKNAEMAKICQLKDGKVLALSSIYNQQKTEITKFEKDAKPIYENYKLSKGYTISAQITGSQLDTEYYLIHHNKQTIVGQDSHEYVTKFKDNDNNPIDKEIKNSIYKTTSIISLKSGQILLVGINPINALGAEADIEVNLYNPNSNTFEHKGISFKGYDNLISCYEQSENEVYCAYISTWNLFVNKLALKHLKIQNGVIIPQEDIELIKNFYTSFNFLKAIRFNDQETLILFQTGNVELKENLFGNSGKDLYFYHYSTSKHTALRYEYLFNDCTYEKETNNANADIIALSDKRIFAVCEYGKYLKGFSIVDKIKSIDRFEIIGFNGNSVKNPVFAKFDKTVSIFFTQETSDTSLQVIYSMLNYPNCTDFEETLFLPRNYKYKNVTFVKNILMGNPYPETRGTETIKVRFLESPIIIFNENGEELSLNEDYDISNKFLLFSNSNQDNYELEFTATRNDLYDGLIIGNTCKLKINTPFCLDQCNSCNQTGNNNIHFCSGCKNESYYIDKVIPYFGEEFENLHNCYSCDYACYSCKGPLIEKKTTNCKKCYYERGYYPYEKDDTLCISEENRDEWETYINHGIYLDKPDEKDKTTWIWRNCHDNCRRCHEKGDDENNKCDYCIEGFYFYCSQTTTNGGIPGTCHNDCVDNGFYPILKEDRWKCCPCLENCQKCTNDTICNYCKEDFFLTLDSKQCVEQCEYCLAEIKEERKCINCKTRDQYLLNKTCVPDLNYKDFPHHIIDDTCNLIMGCQEGCYKCAPWYSDECTECKKDYYKEDFYGITPKPRTFRCFNKTVCQGIHKYAYNENVRVGGVPVKENNTEVCLNCKLRNNTYRQPEYNFTCGPKKNKTYLDIEEYNKLTDCYFRCKSCDNWGNSYFMNCTACREENNYELFLYHAGYGNCYKKTHKCGIYPYYHDYDIAEAMGYDEENCGENCDVCLYNFSCTEHFPYFKYETHECVEYCPITQVLENSCNMNHSAALTILLRNPFGLKNPYDLLNSSLNIQEYISNSLIYYIAQSYNIDSNAFGGDINNYFGNGKIFNLQKSAIIAGNNITLELTTFKLELEKLIEKLSREKEKEGETTGDSGPTATKEDEPESSILDISECEALLKKKYGLPEEEDLMIIKGDLLKQLSDDYFGNSVDYQIFSTSLGAFLPLTDCIDAGVTATVSNPFNANNLLTEFQYKTGAVTNNGYNPFDYNSAFYNDICTDFTNENGNDVLLDDRRKDYFQDFINLCEPGCKFRGYNISTNMYTCICNIKATPGEQAEEYTGDNVTNEIPKDFRDLVSKRPNIEIFKCFSQVFSSKGQKKNFGSYILLFALFSLICVIIFHYLKERKIMDNLFDKLGKKSNLPKPKEDINDNEKHIRAISDNNNDNDNILTSKNEKIEKVEKQKVNTVVKGLLLTIDELNNSSYEIAEKKDHRNVTQYYWSLLKSKQLFIFTFYTSNDSILRSTKIALFILFFTFYLLYTALFFNNSIIRAIYNYKGNTDVTIHIPNIILSSICCLISSLIVRFVFLSERDISNIIHENDPERRDNQIQRLNKITKIKLLILYIISLALIMLFWYYVSAFCAIFKNSQGYYFINVLVSFIICNLWPCIICLIPAILRRISLEKKNQSMYYISQIVAYL